MMRDVRVRALRLGAGWGLFLCLAPALAALTVLPETDHARREMLSFMTSLHRPSPETRREALRQRSGDIVLFRTYHQGGRIYYVFAHPDQEGGITLAAPGTWIIRRRLEDGAFEQAKIFLQHHEGSFLRIVPRGAGAVLEMDLAGIPFYRGVPVPLSMRRLLTAPLRTLQESTAGIVDWSLLDVRRDHQGYRRVMDAVTRIRPVLPLLGDADDGGMNAAGEMVYIATELPQEDGGGFNCSGFAKWVVDGFLLPLRGEGLPLAPLRERHRDLRGTSWSSRLEESRDPYFGLDWTRNLALQYHGLRDFRTKDPSRDDPRQWDVRNPALGEYRENLGFPLDQLERVLYWLALREPGHIYLGSVSRSFGDAPVLRQHAHVAVFFPWFDLSGRFRLAVMERGIETDLESLNRRYGGEFVHLVRIQAGSSFSPPGVDQAVPDLSVLEPGGRAIPD
ncbi:hypothetical protein SAMN05920897_11646 [Alkalispirochaeta americana]|uniref:Uncharacterized protein n=1 Tax=Alkalispirochaeta americana TaxID=159291 RepID=A0A1N6W1E4_9SPIO|nr:hypothetical protein [Alkalispirochaeta americana]SIQ83736.1 hypothetical protein SAMN05920897_11646 [Alkalispirochaeta americana]